MKNLLFSAITCLFFLIFEVQHVSAAHISAYYGPGFGGLAALIILILDIIAIVEVIQSNRSMGAKLLWILFILFCPLIGLIVYCLLARKSHHSYTPV